MYEEVTHILSAIEQGDMHFTQYGTMVGTLQYMSPEQADSTSAEPL